MVSCARINQLLFGVNRDFTPTRTVINIFTYTIGRSNVSVSLLTCNSGCHIITGMGINKLLLNHIQYMEHNNFHFSS